ncbi:hypothetical protein [Candidatus Halobonum tyrrellensis]|uniref:hypothetical protein n=1 Tax=Candidatus Halobonum tyrrellensis TaxID=1431545 RepID=UPI00190F0DE9|nr:hypothetical protein [Candidatus Halobonum tyrrellensis]
MDESERLKTQLAMFVSGAAGWLATAEDADVDDEVIEEVEQAHEHAREAFDLFREEEQ